jgi:hypothetical protein
MLFSSTTALPVVELSAYLRAWNLTMLRPSFWQGVHSLQAISRKQIDWPNATSLHQEQALP